MMRQYRNYIDLHEHSEGNERRYEMLNDVLQSNTFLPKTLHYEDIDHAFIEWVDSLDIVSDDGTLFPTMKMYSNQRFSEYSQSWQHVDSNNNLLLNFKSVTRDNNPEYGNIQGGLWNIPGDRFFLMKRKVVLDDNGTESLLDLKMRQPTAVDFTYKVSVFTTKFQKVNEFNEKLNRMFNSRQVYICPNGHYMPMSLEAISDESSYNIDDRQFYSQTFTVKVNGYIITEEDYRIEERPLKYSINISTFDSPNRKIDVELEEGDICQKEDSPYYYKPIVLSITFPTCRNQGSFIIDTDFKADEWEFSNILNNYKIYINGEEVVDLSLFSVKEGDEIKFSIRRRYIDKDSMIIINGHTESIVFDERDEEPESDLDYPDDHHGDEYDITI